MSDLLTQGVSLLPWHGQYYIPSSVWIHSRSHSVLLSFRAFIEDTFLPPEEVEEIATTKSILDKTRKDKDLSSVFLMRLSCSHLKSVGDIGLCQNLTICILNNNYIKRIEPLVSCLFLMKLDLHSNQVY